jgi:acyl-CoA synthetase (AMP-forming)/AMP-acid ligase II
MPALPIFVLHNLALGVTSVLPDGDPRRPQRLDPAALYRQIQREGVTTVSAAPAFCARLAEWCAATGRRLPLSCLRTGGAPVLPPLARLLRETVDGAVRVVYGSTEAEPIAAIEAEELLAAAADGEGLPLGRPVAGLDCRVLRPCDGPIALGPAGWDEWEVAPGEAGELVVSGPQVLAGYLDDPEADRRHKIRDGGRAWHRTGDAVRFDREGRLRLMGRVGERVERAGEIWWPLPVEMRVREVPGVTHAAYLGLPDEGPRGRALLWVESPAGRLSPAEHDLVLAAARPAPVDDLLVLRRIPRDPRHASKTDMEALRSRLRRR